MDKLIELLPLPSVLLNWPHPTNHVAIRDYARACVAHATTAKDAEIERLKVVAHGFVDEIAARETKIEALQAQLDWTVKQNDTLLDEGRKLTARAKRLAEALRDARDYVTTALREEREKFAGHEDCSDIPGIEADLHKIDSALNPTGGNRHG